LLLVYYHPPKMKVILTGSTGFIGQEVLNQCLANPSITSVIALSRRDLPASVTTNPKLKVIIHKDYTIYPDDMLNELAGSSACIWSLGSFVGKSTVEAARKVNVDAPLEAAKVFAAALASQLSTGAKFRFIFVSGQLSEKDQTKSLWIFQDSRRFRGEVETKLSEFASQKQKTFEAFLARPAAVLPRNTAIREWMIKTFIPGSKCVRLNHLAMVLVDIALNGSETQTIENGALEPRAMALLRGS